jgi:hypothetical protein
VAGRRTFVEAGLVAAATVWFVWRAVTLDAWDRPLGNDWESYLRNVVAVGTHRWATYNGWRGPLHAWLTLAALPLCGTPLLASKTLSVLATATAVPATWALGRALAIPGAVWGAILVGLWPDLEVVAHYSSMYPLLMALLVGGAALVSTATLAGAVAGGVLFGLTGATDIRGLALAACFVAAAAVLRPTRRDLVRLATCAGVAALVAGLLLVRVPVRQASLAEQIATQSILAPMDDVPTANVRALLDGGPHVLVIVLLCVPIGLLADPRSRLPLAAPVAAIAAPLAIVPLQFRYFLPVAPFIALLAAGGITVLFRRAPWFVPGLVVLFLCGTRRLSDESLLHKLRHPGPGSIELDAAGFAYVDEGITVVERAQREQAFAQVLDCSTLRLVDVVVYPTPLLHPPPEACARVAREGVLGGQETLFLTNEPSTVSPTVWHERAVVPAQDPTTRSETRVGVYTSARR